MKLSYKYHTWNVPLRLLRLLKRRMRWIRAAGGIVADDGGHLLLIRRNDRWDLPKGKVEEGETLQQAALREVTEETGLAQLSILHCQPVKTYHIYNLYGGWHLKQTSWFTMHTAGQRPPCTPQADEGITDCEWVESGEWLRRLSSSYGTLRTLSQTAASHHLGKLESRMH